MGAAPPHTVGADRKAKLASMTEQNINATPPEGEQAPPPENTNPNMKWYIIHSYSGFERKVKESLESRIQAFGLGEKIGKVVIPTEPVTEIRNGKKYTVERMFYPGYVLVEIECDEKGKIPDNVFHVIKSTPKVTGFVGSATNPPSVPDHEVARLTQQIDEGVRGIEIAHETLRGEISEANAHSVAKGAFG